MASPPATDRRASTFAEHAFNVLHADIVTAKLRPGEKMHVEKLRDVYGVGASMFACLAAFAPQAADARVQEDHLVSAKKIWSGAYSDNLLEVIDWCLRLDPLERPQSVFALQKAIRDIPPRKRKLTFLASLKKMLFSEVA